MRVLMLGWEFPPHMSGGLGTACEGIVRGLSGHDVEVTFVVPRLGAGHEDLVANVVDCGVTSDPHRPVEIEAALLPYLTAEQYERLADRRGRSGDYGADLLAEVERYARAVEENLSGDYEVVHCHDWMTFPAGILAARKLTVPLVVHVHSCEYDRAGKSANPRVVAVEQSGLDAANRIVVVSRYTERQLRSQYRVDAGKIRVVHNAVAPGTPPTPSTPSTPPARSHARIDEPIVLFLGRVTAQKGPSYFLEAAARVVAEKPRVKFIMVGNGDMLPAMIERAAELGLARHVHFTGFLRGADVDRIYDEASLYVLTSVSEPFGIAPLEALARDVPVIVSKQSGVTEVLSNVLEVDFWDVDALAGRIVEVLGQPELAQRLAADGRADLRELTWERQAGLLMDVYAELTA